MNEIDLHPIMVHFPIAMWTVYCLFELVNFKKITQQSYWFFVKATILITGTVGAGLALITGEIAEEMIEETKLVETHSKLAFLTTWFFGFITIYYLWRWWRNDGSIKRHAPLMVLAVIGLMLITATGALGGTIVYGTTTDPIAKLIYDLLIKK